MSLLDNAYDSVNESLRLAQRAETSERAWKFAILNLVQAIKLLLKERLYRENRLFIYDNIDKPRNTVCSWPSSESNGSASRSMAKTLRPSRKHASGGISFSTTNSNFSSMTLSQSMRFSSSSPTRFTRITSAVSYINTSKRSCGIKKHPLWSISARRLSPTEAVT
jgi:hypothetical protein